MYHCHTDYSLLDSCTGFQDYIDLAVQNGQRAIASTEHGKPLGWVSKKLACDAAGIKFIHGVEIYLTESLEEKVRDNYHTVLLAKNLDGVYELNRLVSMSCDERHFYYTNRISFDEFLSISSNIITTSACLASPLNKLPDSHPRYMELAKKYDFLEVQAHNHPDQVEFNRRLLKLSKELGKPLIAGTDTHSSSAYKAECRNVLLAAKRKSYGDEDAFDLTYKTYDELVNMFRRQGALPEEVYMEAIENTNRLYDLTEDFELDTSTKYPILYGSREADSEKFSEVVERKFREKVDDGVIPKEQEAAFRSAIDEEMRVFRKLNMDGFMLSMSELVSWCKNQGMAIGTARGSVGGSRVAYVADITDLNPEQWHTVFSRFCNEDRVEIGDIDIDCIETDRPAIFKYIVSRFGADRTARVASFGKLKEKSIVDEVGRCLADRWKKEHGELGENPWSLSRISDIKREFDLSSDDGLNAAKAKYPEIFYYYDGLKDTKVSQSVHPAGMVISPISLDDHYGMFNKDGENCLMMDMDEAHAVGAAKYDFLILKNVKIIRDTCNYLGRSYPKSHEIDWNDEDVWNSMLTSSVGIFQFEGDYAFECLKKFRPKNIFDMALVNASIRPSGGSYREDLFAGKVHKNPSKLIDDILKDNYGYLVYQEDVIKFLQEVCGFSGSEADSTRRAIAKKNTELIAQALPKILDGYCNKSSQPREVAEQEANEFLKVIEDSSSYMFNYNHTIAYCMLGYMCTYFRHYHPLEFITSFLNNAANDKDLKDGTTYAMKSGIRITSPKWGISRGEYFFDKGKNVISKGISSVKYMGDSIADELYDLSKTKHYESFMELLYDLNHKTSLNSRQLDILIKIDFFSEFGHQGELLRMVDLFAGTFKSGDVKQLKRSLVDGTQLEPIVKKYSIGNTKSGGIAKSYTLVDVMSILKGCEDMIKSAGIKDLTYAVKAKNFEDAMGYPGYISGKEEDRPKLYISKVYPAIRKKDGVQFGVNIKTMSIGSGITSSFTVPNYIYKKMPVQEGDIIYCEEYKREGQYFRLNKYRKLE